jgi:ArsR family transcriptional regulator
MADIFDVVADPTRRAILQVLRDRLGAAVTELSAAQFVAEIGVSRQAINRHLVVLRDSGLVTVRERGQERYYALDSSPLDVLEEWIGQFIGISQHPSAAIAGPESAAFSAWSGVDVGEAVGRSIAERSYQARSAIKGASERVSARLPQSVSKRARKRL